MPREKVLNQDIVMAFSRDDVYRDNLLYVYSTKLFYMYTGRYYVEVSQQKMHEMIWSFMFTNFPDINITSGLVSDVYSQLIFAVNKRIDDIKTPYIALEDKLLNTDTFSFHSFDKDKIAINYIPINSKDMDMETPVFDAYIKSICVNDKLQEDVEMKPFLQEMFGYYLTNSLKTAVVFFLVGKGSNGKSVMLNLLKQMVGIESCTAMSIESLTTDKFMTSDLVGKKLNVCAEEESKHLRSDKFKALITGDHTQAQRKYGGSFIFQPTTKYVFATNDMPSFEGLNHGLKRRMKIVMFHRIFSDAEQDKDLEDKLKKEMPGILRWAIEGGKRLQENKWMFTEPRALKMSMAEFAQGISTAVRFMYEEFQVDPLRVNWFPEYDLYSRYKEWCQVNGRKALNSTNFRRDIEDNVVGLLSKGVRSNGKNVRMFNIMQRTDEFTIDELEGKIPEVKTISDISIENISFYE